MEKRALVEFQQICKAFSGRTIIDALDLVVHDGEFLTLLGPSGCGKTTLLRLLAGFEQPDSGILLLDSQPQNDKPANQRQVNTVFQSYALFPHMNVFENIAFGLKMQKRPQREIDRRVAEAIAMVQLEGLEKRRPFQLSGGQQQRVAIARAVVNRPRVLLLDECLNALDSKLRKQMQIELKQLQRQLGITFIFVTHDQEEALAMSDRVAVMQDGRIEQLGTPRQIYEEPANLFVARFIGEANLFAGRILSVEATSLLAEVEGRRCRLNARRPYPCGAAVKVLLRPEDLRLAAPGEQDGWPGKVIERTYKGMTLDSVIELDSGLRLLASEFFDEDDPSFDYSIGERVVVRWVENWEVVLPDADPEPL